MNLEEFKAVAEKVRAALEAAGFGNPEILEFEPGDGAPIAFGDDNEGDFVVELNVL